MMRSIVRIGLSCLLLFGALLAQGQQLSGVVTDTSGLGLPFASVVVRGVPPDSTIIGYTQADSAGRFQLSIEVGKSFQIVVSSLGYTTEVLDKSGSDRALRIKLAPSSLELNEVLVKASPPLRFQKDTTSYRVASFSDGTERNMEDLLKKLPGVKVDDKGNILFNNKAIDRITLDGDDFFAKNYKLLSRNITTGLVDRVDAVENVNDSPLLRGLEASDKVILNFSLNKKLLRQFFGSGHAGGGITERYTAQATLFSFIDRIKMGSISGINNVGVSMLDDLKDNFDLDRSTKYNLLPVSNSVNSPVNIPQPFVPGVAPFRYLNNQAKMTSFNLATRISQRLKVDFYVIGQGDRNQNSTTQVVDYFLVDSLFRVTDRGNFSNRIGQFSAQSRFDYSLDSLSALNLTIGYNRSAPKVISELLTSTSNVPASQSVTSGSTEITRNQFAKLNYTRRLSLRTAFSAEAQYSDNHVQQTLRLKSPRYGALFPELDANTGIRQGVSIPQRQMLVLGRWIGSHARHQYEFQLAYSALQAQFNSNVRDELTLLPVSAQNYRNALRYNRQWLDMSLRDQITLGKLSVTGTFSVNGLDLAVADSARNDKLKTIFWRGNLRMNWRLGRANRLALTLSSNTLVSSPTDLFTGSVFSNYRDLIQADPRINQSRQWQANLYYSYFEPDSYTRVIVSGTYQRQNSPYILSYRATEQVNFFNRIPIGFLNQSGNLGGEVSRLVNAIRAKVSIQGNVLTAQTWRGVDETIIVPNNLRGYSLGGTLATAFDRYVNLLLTSKVNQNSLVGNGSPPISTLVFEHQATLKFTLPPVWAGQVVYNEIRWPNLTSRFVDASLVYKPERRKFSLEARASNLLDSQFLSFDNIGSNESTQSQFSLTPRIVYLTLSFMLGQGK